MNLIFKKVIIFLCSFLLIMSIPVFADDPVGDDNIFTNPKTGPRPGKNDPMKPNFNTIFRDDEALMMVGFPDHHKAEFITQSATGKSLTSWSHESATHQYLSSEFIYQEERVPPVLASARGRISDHTHDQTAYAFYRPDGQVQVEIWNPPAREPSYIKIPGRSGSGEGFIDVAVGDLDLAIEDNKYYHDEIVVVRGGGKSDGYRFDVFLDIIDYKLNVLVDTLHVPNSKNVKASTASVEIGDLDGDGFMEIVVAQVRSCELYQLDVYGFEREDNGEVKTPHTLKHYSSTQSTGSPTTGVMDLAIGDFNDDGNDDVAMTYDFYLNLFAADDKLVLCKKSHTIFYGNAPERLKLVSGLFKLDDDWGGIRRRQLAVFWRQENGVELFYKTYAISIDLLSFVMIGDGALGKGSFDYKVGTFGVSVGNYVGHLDDSKSPNEQIAVAYEQRRAPEYNQFLEYSTPHFAVLDMNSDGSDDEIVYDWAGTEYYMGIGKQLAVTVSANDMDGDSYRLGPPVHFTVENHLYLDYIIQEPPKHVDYLPTDPDEPEGAWQVFNLSAYEDFNVTLDYEKSASVETETKTATSMSFGASIAASSEETIGGEVGDIGSAELSEEVKAKASYDYSNTESKTDKKYSETTLFYTCSTSEDDFIKGKVQLIDIWRYPIYGVKTTDKKHGFQEIIFPGPVYSFEGAGMAHADWYQPTHQNRNLFSYPHLADTAFPNDLGSFTSKDKDDNDMDSKSIVMNDMTMHSWGGTTEEWKIDWNSEAGEQCHSILFFLSLSFWNHYLNFLLDFFTLP